jgi:integrase
MPVIRNFFRWIDLTGRSATLDSVEQDYVDYADHLLHRVRVLENLSEVTAYAYAITLSNVLNDVLQLKIGLLARTRLRKPRLRRPVFGTLADKQNLENTFAFGRLLLDIADALTVEAIRSTPPVTIRFTTGQILEEWCYLTPLSKWNALSRSSVSQRKRAARETDTSFRTRHPLINLRIEAELLIFIAQTGMNPAQAHALKIGKFRYHSHLDGYRVYRAYKGRRGGEVEFDIYSEYRTLFERYLHWRDTIFPSSEEDRLFPFVIRRGANRHLLDFQAIRERCKRLGVPCIRPQKLRKTRVNWLLRRSRDPNLTAEMDQHSQETLLRVYDQPHHQVAVSEITRFHMATDPAIALAMPGPGTCAGGAPHPETNTPPQAPTPDCVSPAGCLFCDHHRDIDTEDHVWSLATYRHFKSIELGQYRSPAKDEVFHPAAAVIDRVTSKLKRFEASSEVRSLWVREAAARVDEGNYHPKWDGFIQLMELRA